MNIKRLNFLFKYDFLQKDSSLYLFTKKVLDLSNYEIWVLLFDAFLDEKLKINFWIF